MKFISESKEDKEDKDDDDDDDDMDIQMLTKPLRLGRSSALKKFNEKLALYCEEIGDVTRSAYIYRDVLHEFDKAADNFKEVSETDANFTVDHMYCLYLEGRYDEIHKFITDWYKHAVAFDKLDLISDQKVCFGVIDQVIKNEFFDIDLIGYNYQQLKADLQKRLR